jgi:hypothetical protein
MPKAAPTLLLVCAQGLALGMAPAGCAAFRNPPDNYAAPSLVRGDTVFFRLRWPGDDATLDAQNYCAQRHQSFEVRKVTNTVMSFDCVAEPETPPPGGKGSEP